MQTFKQVGNSYVIERFHGQTVSHVLFQSVGILSNLTNILIYVLIITQWT